MIKPKWLAIATSVFSVILIIVVIVSANLLNQDRQQFAPEESFATEANKAFPSAMGYGSNTKGGRGGRVIKVTNLNGEGEGSFWNAVTAGGSRIVVFDVAGEIDIPRDVEITNPNITIAGQTAPSPGISIKGGGLKIMASEVIIRNIAIRPGGLHGKESDSIQLSNNARNIILDHVSLSFSIDEVFSTHFSTAHNITLQNSIVAFPLNCSIHSKGCHGYGFLLDGDSTKISIINNLVGFATDRHPRVKENAEVEFIGNYILQVREKCVMSQTPSVNIVNNIYENPRGCGDDICAVGAGDVYAAGNTCDGEVNNEVDSRYSSSTPVFPLSITNNLTGEALKNFLYEKAGKIYPDRDGIDREIVKRFKEKSSHLIDSPGELSGGYDLIPDGPIHTERNDTDNDGIANYFEARWGLDYQDPTDANKVAANGYTNIENYINSLAGDELGLEGPCEPSCSGKDCGADGCGGSCGTCDNGFSCEANKCVEDVCTPQCSGKECGTDGCGGTCGSCGSGESCESGQCVEDQCTPNCTGRSCGSDGCGGNCGECGAGEECQNYQCEEVNDCKPQCDGRSCGSDGCGDVCGVCGDDKTCVDGQCLAGQECTPDCDGRSCGSDGCDGSCGSCESGESCESGQCVNECTPSCSGKDCGSDGCGGTCGTCGSGEACDDGSCVSECVPSCTGKECGSDGCGGSCGSCSGAEICSNNQCDTQCVPNCTGKTCGSDGCGGSCGTCTSGTSCNNGSCVNSCIPSCSGKQCGNDGCGGSCGTCSTGYLCSSYLCVVSSSSSTSGSNDPYENSGGGTYYQNDQNLPQTSISKPLLIGFLFVAGGLILLSLSLYTEKDNDHKKRGKMQL